MSISWVSVRRTGYDVNTFKSIADTWNDPITPAVREHLSKVYRLLAITCLCASLGAAFDMRYHVGGWITKTISFFLLNLLVQTTHAKASERSKLLYIFGFLSGISIAPLIGYAVDVDSSSVLVALLLTANLFICLTLAAAYLPKRTAFVIASMLAPCFTAVWIITMISIFSPSLATSWLFHSFNVYVGLFVSSGYLVVDNQIMLMNAIMAQHDRRFEHFYVDDALQVFCNLLSIFVRILSLVTQASENKKDKKKDSK